jgi:F-type H+-transporting ATPase subunit b
MMLALAEGKPLVADWILQVVAFVIVFGVLWKFVIVKIFAGMAKREEDIRKRFEEIEKKQADMDLQVKEYAKRLQDIEQTAAVRMKEAVAEGLKLKAEMEAEAKRRAEEEVARTQTLVQIESDQAIATLRKEAARLSMEQAERLIREAMNTELQARLVDRYLAELDKVKQV